MSNKKEKKVIKKPNGLIYWLGCLLIMPYLKFRLHTTIDRKELKNIKEPSIVVCTHMSNIDFLLVGAALFPHRPTFIVSNHFMANPKTRWILKLMHVISKKMFCPDIKTILSIMRAKESGNIIVIFPEGRLSCFGHTLQVTDGTAELIKKLGIDVYLITEDGAYKTLPKWSKEGFRPGRIHVRCSKLIDAEKLPDMTADKIHKILDNAILHDDDKVFTDIRYKCSRPAKNLENILYKCPECLSEFTTATDDRTIYCSKCGMRATLDETYTLCGTKFNHINEWFFWQEETVDLDIPLETDAILGAVGKDGNMDRNAGFGHICMDREKIHFKGECFGEPLEFTESTSIIKGFPASAGNHFDLYSGKKLYYIIPQPEKRQNIKWVIYLDKLTKEREKKVQDA